MTLRRIASLLLVLLWLPLSLALTGCSALQSIAITPASGLVVLTAAGQTAQFTAIGASQVGSAPQTSSNVTGSVTWSVSNPSVATINSAGLATAVGGGYTQVLAESNGITATSDLTVNIAKLPTTPVQGTVISVSVIPGTQSVSAPSQTSQFIAIGTTTTGATVNLTNQVAWSSSSTQIATIGASSGLATAVGQGTATIAALYSLNGSVIAGTATFTVTAGTTEKYTAVAITPSSQSLSASGQTGQFIALGTSGTGLQTDVTSSPQIKWSSSIPSVVSVSASGLATGLGAGSSTITAVLSNADGTVVSATATVAVSITPAPEPLLSLTIIPSAITVGNLQDTSQFLAIGTYATAPYTRDLTNSPNLTWISAVPSVFPVNTNSGGNAGATAGIVTAYGNGSAVIIAEATNPLDGTIQTATATFNCPLILPTPTTAGSCYPGSQTPALLATLTVYNEGLNTTNWLVTAPSATGTPSVLHCGPGSLAGGSVCVATYPVGTTVTLTAPATSAFGGWSYNCTPTAPLTATGANSCTVTLTTNDTVGAIFN
jgi:Bacterial Ig-like domain (group 2)